MGDTGGIIARVGVRIHKAHAGRDVYIVFDDDFPVHDEGNIVSDVNTVSDDEAGIVKNPATGYGDVAKKIDAVSDRNAGMADNIRHKPHVEAFPYRDTAAPEQGLPVEEI